MAVVRVLEPWWWKVHGIWVAMTTVLNVEMQQPGWRQEHAETDDRSRVSKWHASIWTMTVQPLSIQSIPTIVRLGSGICVQVVMGIRKQASGYSGRTAEPSKSVVHVYDFSEKCMCNTCFLTKFSM